MAFKSSWLIGSYLNLPEQDLEVNDEPISVPMGSYYLRDAAAPSLILAFSAALFAGDGVVASVFLTRSRHVRITAPGVFKVDWIDTLLPTLLGFSANLAGSSSYTAPNISPLLWSPGRPETTNIAPLGVRGHRVPSVYQSVSPYDGTTESISHGFREYNRFGFVNVGIDRVWTKDEKGGEWVRWFQEIAVKSAPWKMYRNVVEESGVVTTEVAYPDAALGPYVCTAERRGIDWTYDRSKGKEYTDTQSDIFVPCHVVPEIS